jgi:hypothetical protein
MGWKELPDGNFQMISNNSPEAIKEHRRMTEDHIHLRRQDEEFLFRIMKKEYERWWD